MSKVAVFDASHCQSLLEPRMSWEMPSCQMSYLENT